MTEPTARLVSIHGDRWERVLADRSSSVAVRAERVSLLWEKEATLNAMPPKAPASKTPANVNFHLIVFMVMPLDVCARRGFSPRRVQRSGAGPFAKDIAGCGRPNAGRRPTSSAIRLRQRDSCSLACATALRRRLVGRTLVTYRLDHRQVLLLRDAVCDTIRWRSPPARRPSAGAMPGR